jgi:uncharacterized membrane protein
MPAGPGPQPIAVAAPLADNIAAALCYGVWVIVAILFLVLEPYSRNKTVRFHAFQALFFHVACIVVWIAFTIVFDIFVGLLHVAFLGALANLVWLAFLLAWLYLVISAYQGKTVVLPIIGPLAQKQV